MRASKKNKPSVATEPTVAYVTSKGKHAQSEADWAASLSKKELELIERGTADIKNGRVYSHAAAMKKIKAHLKAKTK